MDAPRDLSPTRLFDNMCAMQPYTAGYFLTPYLGATLITLGADFDVLFYTAAGFVLLCLALITALIYLHKRECIVESKG